MKQRYTIQRGGDIFHQFPRITKKFYTEEMYKINKCYEVGNYLGIFFLFIKNFWILFVGLLGQRFTKLSNADANLHFLSENNSFLEFFRNDSSVEGIITFLFIVNGLISITIISIYIHYLYTMLLREQRNLYRTPTQQNYDREYDQGAEISKRIQSSSISSAREMARLNRLRTLKEIFSFILQTYYHVLLIPSIYFPLSDTSNPLSIICLALAILIGLFIQDCDYDYLVKSKDFLAKGFSAWSYSMLAIEIICAIILQVSDVVNFILLTGVFLIKAIYYFLINPYYKEDAKFFSIFISLYLVFFNLILMFCVGSSTLQGLSAFMMFFFVPFSWKVSEIICYFQYEHIKSQFQKLCSADKMVDVNVINLIMRQKNLFADVFNTTQNDKRKIDYFNLISNSAQLYLEELSSIDNQRESKQQTLITYANKARLNGQINVNVSAEDLREQNEMFAKIKIIIQKFMERVVFGSKQFPHAYIFAYLIFLLEIKECKKLYWLSYLIWRSKPKVTQSSKTVQIMQSIHRVFESEKSVLKCTLGHTNPFYEGFMDVIVFEQKVEEAHKLLDRCINLKIEILNMMKQKLIVLQVIMERIESIQFMLIQLRNTLSQLALMNEDNSDLIQLQIYYLTCLSFNESDIAIGQLNQYKKAYLSEIRDIFAKDSCVAFIQHDLSTNSSYFKRVSHNFEKIFSVKQMDIIGKKVDTLLPQIIQEQHQYYIKEFLDEQSSRLDEIYNSILQNNEELNITSQKRERRNDRYAYKLGGGEQFKSICKMGNKIIFALSGDRHLVPVNIDLRVNSLGIDEFGFTAKIKKVKNPFDYILYDTSNFEVIGLSKNISESLFPDVSLSKINLATLFPFLQQAVDKRDDNTQGLGTDYFESERSTQRGNRNVNYDNQQSSKRLPSSNSKRTTTIHTMYVHKKNLHMRVFDFIVILDSTKMKKKTIQSITSTVLTKESIMAKMGVDKETIYIFMEVKVFETGYKNIDNLNYLQISKVKMMNPYEQASLIIAQIRENMDLYLLSFPQSSIDRILQDLEKKSKLSASYANQNQNKSQLKGDGQKNSQDEENSLSPKEQTNLVVTNKAASFILLNSLEQQYFDQKKNDNQKKNAEKESQNTFNEIIEEEGSVSNKSDYKQEMIKINNSHLYNQIGSFNQQSYIEMTQQQGLFSNNQLPMLSPDSSYIQFKQQQNEISQQGMYGNHNNYEKSYFDQSQLTAIGAPVDVSTNDMIKHNFQKKNTTHTQSQNANTSSRDFMNIEQKGSLQNQSTIDSKFFSPRIHSGHNLPLDSAKNMLSPTRLLMNQTQQRFFQDEGNQCTDNLRIEDLKEQNKLFAQELHKKNRRKNKYQGRDIDELDHGDHRMHANDWQAFKQRAEKALNNKYQQDDRRRVHDLQIEIASTSNSKQSSSASAKRQLARILSTNQKIPSMRIIQFIGLACFCILTTVTIWQYFTVVGSITNSQLDFEAFDWPSEFRSMLYQMVKNANLINLLNQNDFTFSSAELKAAYKKNITANLRSSKDTIIAHLAKLERSNPDRLIFQKLRSETFEFSIPLYYNQSIISNTTSVVAQQPGFVGAPVNMSIQYAAIVFNQFCFWYSLGVGGGRPEYFTILNEMNMIRAIKTSENSIIAVQQDEDDRINVQLNSLMAIIFSVSALCIGVVLPLYSYIQFKKDTIVTLLSTFTNEKISNLINNIYQNYYNNKSSSKFLKSIPNDINFQKETESRKQNLSQTTRLPRINKLLCFFVVLIYLFIVCYPVIIKFVTSSYLKQASSNLNLIIQTNSIKAYLNEVIAINYHGLTMKLYPAVKPLQLEWYLEYINQLNEFIPTFENNVNSLTDERYSLNRYDQASYDKVFYPLIDEDICQTLKSHSSYITNATLFNTYECSNIYNGFLTKGFQLSFKEYLSTIEAITGIYSISNKTATYTEAKKNLVNTINLKQFTDFQEYLEETLNVMRTFVLKANTEYYNFIINVQLALIIYQIVVMVLIFIIGWYLFCKEMNEQINKTKRYLQIIDINTLIENSYVITFIKNNINL